MTISYVGPGSEVNSEVAMCYTKVNVSNGFLDVLQDELRIGCISLKISGCIAGTASSLQSDSELPKGNLLKVKSAVAHRAGYVIRDVG